MQTMKFSRVTMLILALVMTVLAAACSPSASPTAAPSGGDTNTTSGSDDPTAVVKSLYDGLYSGGDVASLFCAAAGDVQETFKTAAAGMTSAGVKVDTSGLTYTASNVTADKATVTVGGTLSTEVAGQKTSAEFPSTPVNVTKEGGAWKICA